MDMPPKDPWAYLAVAWAAFIGLLTWSAKRQVAAADDHEVRIKALETDRVTKGDVSAIYNRINLLSDQSHEQYSDLSQRMSDQHSLILKTIIDQQASR